MYKDKPFPYPLTQLEGFDPTSYEYKVMSSPAFQQLRKVGLPMFGTLGTALSFEYLPPHNVEKGWVAVESPMSPNALSTHCSDQCDLIRKVAVVAAQIREATAVSGEMADPRNQRLLQDLAAWLNYAELKHFRWEEHWNHLEERIENGDWYRQVAEFQASGDSDLIVLLTSTLNKNVRQTLRCQLVEGVTAAKQIKGRHITGALPHFPHTTSIWSLGKQQTDDLAFALIDCGDVAGVKSWITDRRLQRQITAVRFELPRTCFVGSLYWRVMSAPMLIFDVEALDDDQRELVRDHLVAWLGDRQNQPELRPDKGSDAEWRATKVLCPANEAQLTAVVLAGPASHYFGWQKCFSPNEERDWSKDVNGLFDAGMAVSRAKTADD